MVTIKDEFETIVISLKSLEIKDTTDDTGKWMIKNLDFSYLSSVVTDSIPSATNTVQIVFLTLKFKQLWHAHKVIDNARLNIDNADRVVFKVPARRVDRKSIIFGRVQRYAALSNDSENEVQEAPQFYH